MYEELKAQLNPNGSVKQEAYDLLRSLGPMPCVDVVLVPQENKPSVILFLRGPNIVAPNQYWVVGGRVNKGETLEDAAQRKTKKESGLDLLITPEDQLFTDQTIFTEPPYDNGLVGMIHTTNTVYLGRTPSFEEIEPSLKAADGNERYGLFSYTDRRWHPYVIKCVERAWERVFN